MNPDPPLQFVVSGTVTVWNPRTRLLCIGEYELWIAPEVSFATPAIGARGTAVGHEEPSGRRVVTRLMKN